MRVVHIITGLSTGGAEFALYRLLAHMDRDRFEPTVISLGGDGPLGEKIRALNIPVFCLGIDARRPNPLLVYKLVKILRQMRPTLLQTWMYHADLLGGLAGFLTHTPVVWGIRNTSLDPSAVKSSTIRVVHLNARLSGWIPRQIVSCSETARREHVDIGYNASKFVVIPNGFDLSDFHPNPGERASLRRELGLPPNTFLIGIVARFDPLKDQHTFIQAAGIFYRRHPEARFLMCGDGLTPENRTISTWLDSEAVSPACHLLGRRDDIPRLMAALDVNTLSSIGEAFPNVLGEAMACGVPCVATDVGDSATLIGDTGITVPPKDPQGLAEGWERLWSMSAEERHALGERARQRIQQHFSITEIARRYEALYEQIAAGKE